MNESAHPALPRPRRNILPPNALCRVPLAVLFLVFAALQPTIASQPFLLVKAPKAILHLEIANTEPEREQGLMNRYHLDAHSGMLFVFPADQPVSFWMKNTLISLDMVFADANGKVRQVLPNVATISPSTPDDRIPLELSTAKYVIELSAGEAAKDGIVPGVVLMNITSAPAAK